MLQAINAMDGKRTAAGTALSSVQAKPDGRTVSAAESARDELEQAIALVATRYAAYRAIPCEVGDAAEQALRGWP